jgi:cytochrome c553
VRIVALALSLLVLYAAEPLTLGKSAPRLFDTKIRSVLVFERLDKQAEQQLQAIGLTVRLVRDQSVKEAYGVTSEERVAVLVDEHGVLRRVVRRNEDAGQFAATLVKDMRAWDDGKAIYEGQCARCHGEDGNGRNYPNIKTLGGIGNRLTEAEIAERTGQVGTVDLTVLGERVKSLAAYVAGL